MQIFRADATIFQKKKEFPQKFEKKSKVAQKYTKKFSALAAKTVQT